jgi:hypothetical protein
MATKRKTTRKTAKKKTAAKKPKKTISVFKEASRNERYKLAKKRALMYKKEAAQHWKMAVAKVKKARKAKK